MINLAHFESKIIFIYVIQSILSLMADNCPVSKIDETCPARLSRRGDEFCGEAPPGKEQDEVDRKECWQMTGINTASNEGFGSIESRERYPQKIESG